MTNYIKRLVYLDSAGHKINPLFYPFIFAIIVYGLGFLFAGGWSGVSSSSLYQSFYGVHEWLPTIWGGAAMAAGLSASAMLLLRRATFGVAASMFGFLVWLFASIVYLLGGYYLVAFTVTGPNLYFWVYYYLRLKWYSRQKKAGKLRDAG